MLRARATKEAITQSWDCNGVFEALAADPGAGSTTLATALHTLAKHSREVKNNYITSISTWACARVC